MLEKRRHRQTDGRTDARLLHYAYRETSVIMWDVMQYNVGILLMIKVCNVDRLCYARCIQNLAQVLYSADIST